MAREAGLGIDQIFRSLQGLDDTGVQTLESAGPGSLGLGVESATELFSEDFHGNSAEFLVLSSTPSNMRGSLKWDLGSNSYIEHNRRSTAGEVSTAEGVDLVGEELAAAQGLDDDIQAGQDGVSLSQEVAVAQKLVLGNAGERAEHLLVFGMGLDEAGYQQRGLHVALLFVWRNTIKAHR